MNLFPPQTLPVQHLLPEEPLLMMGAGPVPIPASVAQANSIVINHLGNTMSVVIDQIKRMSRYVFQTNSEWVIGVAGPGSAAMEMAVSNIVFEKTRVLSVCNGFFSKRLSEMAARAGGSVYEHVVQDCHSADPDLVLKDIKKHKPEVLTIVHGETSNTIINSSLKEICQIAKENNILTIVDAVCTLSTTKLEMDNWNIDAVITGGQKGLSSIPGVSLVAFSSEAWKRISNRKQRSSHWCLDAKLAFNFWHNNSYHYTAPVSGLLALHEALRLVCQETLPLRFYRHEKCSIALQKGIEAMGLSLYSPPQSRLNSVIGINIPDGIKSSEICTHISKKYKVEIAGSFGLNIIRIGQMGEQSREHNLFRTLHALGSTMQDLGFQSDIPNGVAILESTIQKYSNATNKAENAA